MNSIPFRRLAAISLLFAGSLCAQDALVTIQAATSRVLVNGSAQLSAAITTVNGTPLDASGLTWASSDSTVAAVSGGGLVTGITPGDVRIGVTDANTGMAAWTLLHVVPASLSLSVNSVAVAIGDTVQLSASALDAAGKNVPGLRFQYRSGQPSVATVSADGVITGVAEGSVTVQAAIAGVAADPALIATTQIRVVPKPKYKIRKILSTDAASSTSVAAVTRLSAVSSAAVGSIVTFTNGGQAAVLIEGSKSTVLAAVGQTLPATGRLPLRIDAISVNSRGDAAVLIEYPAQWCSASVFLFPHGQPEIELGPANCNDGIASHSLADDGSVIFRMNDQVWSASASGTPALLFSLATQPASSDPLRSINNFTAGVGAFMIGGTLNSGATAYFWSDGKTFRQVYRNGDRIRSSISTSIDLPVAGAGGVFYARVNTNAFLVLVQIDGSGLKPLIATGDSAGPGTLGWIHYVSDAGTAGLLLAVDLNVPNNYHSAAALWTNGSLTELAAIDGWASLLAGALPSDGTPIVSVQLKGESKLAGLRTLPSSGSPRTILAGESVFSQPIPAGVNWHYASRGGTAAVMPMRAAGDAIVSVDSAVHALATTGSPLPNGKMAVWIGAAMSNTAGDVVFTATYSNGSGIFRYRGGQGETLVDTNSTGLSALSTPSWVNTWYAGRYLATNNHGDVLHVSSYQNGTTNQLVLISNGAPKLVAAQNSAAPGGALYGNFNQVALNENGHVLFTANTNDGKTGAYFWDGNSVQRLIATGDTTPSGTVNEVSNVAGAGQGFVILLAFDNYRARELRYFDGRMRTIDSTDTSLLDGFGISYFWTNETTLGVNGDAHYQVQTQDGGAGVYARRADGSLAIVARSRDPLPGGEWLIFPLAISSGSAGEVWFTAYTWNQGIESLGLYLATLY